MKKYINIKYVLAIAIAGLIALPASASAATVYVESSRTTIAVGDTAIIAVKINSDGAVLNTVDGDVALKSTAGPATSGGSVGSFSVQQFSLANSAFGLWPRTPSLSTDGGTVSFVGGVPGGFSIEGATLFKMIIQANKAGTITVSPQNMSVFANDGKGTKVSVKLQSLSINVTPQAAGATPVNDWSSVVSTDVTPPEDFIIVLGQDPSLSGGQKFAYFSAVDNQSGIDHYEVSENGAPFVRTGSTYVLQDQTGDVKLTVVAYDKAGNKKSASYPAAGQQGSTSGIAWPSIIVVVLVIVIVYMIYKKIVATSKKNKSNAPTNL